MAWLLERGLDIHSPIHESGNTINENGVPEAIAFLLRCIAPICMNQHDSFLFFSIRIVAVVCLLTKQTRLGDDSLVNHCRDAVDQRQCTKLAIDDRQQHVKVSYVHYIVGKAREKDCGRVRLSVHHVGDKRRKVALVGKTSLRKRKEIITNAFVGLKENLFVAR